MSDTIEIDTSSFNKFARDLKKAEPELAKSLRKNMKAAGEIVAVEARQRAGFSSRIPGNIKVGVAGARIRVYVKPLAKPHFKEDFAQENKGKSGMIRHKTFGHADRWTSKNSPAHPFLKPALEARRALVVVAAKKAVDDALRQVHSHG